MNISVKAYDHDTNADKIGNLQINLQSLAEFPLERGISEECAADFVKDAQLVIGHFGETAWKQLIDGSSSGNIRIRTSTVGRYNYQHIITDNGVIELNLKPKHDELNSEDWEYILIEFNRQKDLAISIAQGNIPAGMDYYFGGSFPETLTALAILCQGYLAVIKPKSLSIPQGTIDAVTLRNAKEKVQSSDWWLNVFKPCGKSSTNLTLSEFEKEWPKPDNKEELTLWEVARKLVDKILKSEFDIDFTSVVEKAFISIKYRLNNCGKLQRG